MAEQKKIDKYWKQRTDDRKLTAEQIGIKGQVSITKIYEQSLRWINDDIAKVYSKYSKSTGLGVDELSILLNGSERSNLARSLQDKMRKLGFNFKDIYNPNYMAQLSRLDALKQQIYWNIAQIAPQEEKIHRQTYQNIIKQTYDQFQQDAKQIGVKPTFAQIDQRIVGQMVQERWQGRNYSDSLWRNNTRLAEKLPNIVGAALTTGRSYQKTERYLRKMVSDEVDNKKAVSMRLIRTESIYHLNQAEAEANTDDGFTEYWFDAKSHTSKTKVCDICEGLNGKKFKFTDMEVGVNFPPIHPNCGCTHHGVIVNSAAVMKQLSTKDLKEQYMIQDGRIVPRIPELNTQPEQVKTVRSTADMDIFKDKDTNPAIYKPLADAAKKFDNYNDFVKDIGDSDGKLQQDYEEIVQFHGTQDPTELKRLMAMGKLEAREGRYGDGFYVTTTQSAAEYFGKQKQTDQGRIMTQNPVEAIPIDMGKLKIKMFTKDDQYYDPTKEIPLAKKQGYDAIDLYQIGETVVFNPDKVKVLDLKTLWQNAQTKQTKIEANPMMVEAAKYKTAEEFINHKTNAYHGTPNKEFKEFMLDKNAAYKNETSTIGIWVTPQRELAKAFSYKYEDSFMGMGGGKKDVGGTVMGVYYDMKNPKIYETTKPDPQIEVKIEELKKQMPNSTSMMLESDETKKLEMRDKLTDIQSKIKELRLQQDTDGYVKFMNDRDRFSEYIQPNVGWKDQYVALHVQETNEKFVNDLKKQGYDGILIKNTEYDSKDAGLKAVDQIAVFDPKQVYTKEQLKSVWQQANKVEQPTEIAGKNAEQFIMENEGWSRLGLREEFDTAMITKNKEAIQRLLPEVPEAYKQKFSGTIQEALTGKVSDKSDILAKLKTIEEKVSAPSPEEFAKDKLGYDIQQLNRKPKGWLGKHFSSDQRIEIYTKGRTQEQIDSTTLHEIGHILDYKMRGIVADPMGDSIRNFDGKLVPMNDAEVYFRNPILEKEAENIKSIFKRTDSASTTQKEIRADVFRLYRMDNAKLKEVAPILYVQADKFLRENDLLEWKNIKLPSEQPKK